MAGQVLTSPRPVVALHLRKDMKSSEWKGQQGALPKLKWLPKPLTLSSERQEGVLQHLKVRYRALPHIEYCKNRECSQPAGWVNLTQAGRTETGPRMCPSTLPQPAAGWVILLLFVWRRIFLSVTDLGLPRNLSQCACGCWRQLYALSP